MYIANVNWRFTPMKLWKTNKNKNNVFNPFAGKPNGQIILSIWEKLEKYQKDAQNIGIIQTVLIGTDSDVFGSRICLSNNHQIPLKIDSNTVRRKLFDRIIKKEYPNLIFLFLTDHPWEIRKCIPTEWLSAAPENIMFGVTGKTQKEIGKNLISMSNAPGKKFIYIKPEYSNINLNEILGCNNVEVVIH